MTPKPTQQLRARTRPTRRTTHLMSISPNCAPPRRLAIAAGRRYKVPMTTDNWKLRARLFAQRFWQPTGACMTIMPGSVAKLSGLLALAGP